MTRISDLENQRMLVNNTQSNKQRVADLSEQLSSGVKVSRPSDSPNSGTIATYLQALRKVEDYTTTIAETRSFIQIQDDVMAQMNELLSRAKEIAQEGANETVSVTARAHLAEEMFQIRDHVASLANTTYQGRYLYGGADDDDPPYDPLTYTNPSTGLAATRYVFDNEAGTASTRVVQVTDDLSLTTNTPANKLFDSSIQALERLGRSLAGYKSTLTSGVTDGGGIGYTFPSEFTAQTQDIAAAIDLLNTARNRDILPERVSLGGRLRRLETGESLLRLTKNSAEEVLSRIRDADETEVASGLAQAQNALQASYTVTARVLRLSILDYI
jgi:flagellar hook-associated protein 3 FlgL